MTMTPFSPKGTAARAGSAAPANNTVIAIRAISEGPRISDSGKLACAPRVGIPSHETTIVSTSTLLISDDCDQIALSTDFE